MRRVRPLTGAVHLLDFSEKIAKGLAELRVLAPHCLARQIYNMTEDHIPELKHRGDAHTCTSAVIVRDGKILLGLRHYTPDKWKDISVWTTPGGRCDTGESVGEGLRRETREETGIDDLVITRFIGKVPAAGDQRDTLWAFLCETSLDARLMEPEKFSEWRWFPVDAIPQNFINPKILDAIMANVALDPPQLPQKE